MEGTSTYGKPAGAGYAGSYPQPGQFAQESAHGLPAHGPVKKISTGAISAAIWKNAGVQSGKETEFFSVTLERRYNKDGKWLSTKSLRVSDLPRAALVLEEAYKFLVLKNPENGTEHKMI